MRPAIFALSFLVLAPLLPCAGPPPAHAADIEDIMLVSRVRQQAARGDRDGAIALLEAEIRDGRGRDRETTAELIEEVAGLYVASERFAEAGEAWAILADLAARLEGATAPALGGIHEKAGTAYMRAGDRDAAIRHFESQLAVDRRYLDCRSEVLAETLRRLAALTAAAGRTDEARRHGALADDEDARCAADGFAPGSRGIVVEKTFEDADPGNFTTVKVFYATDRARTGSLRIDEFYGGGRGGIEYGVMDVTVPRSHKPGAVEAPSLLQIEWSENPERHIVITRLATLDTDEAMADMRKTLAERGSDEALVFIHGYNVTFAAAARRTAQIAYDLNFDGIPILYSWPSQGSTLSYITDEAVVRLGGRHLMKVLERLLADSGAKRIHIVAHSMGNRALTDALELMAERHVASGATEPLFGQVLFTAPDVDAGLFADMIARIRPIARRLTLYASENDLALSTSRQLHGAQPRAGQAGADILVADTIDTIDMSDLGEDMLGHSYFASDASALTDMLWLMWRDEDPRGRCGMQEAKEQRGVHWRFDPGNCNGGVALSALTLLRNRGARALDFALTMGRERKDARPAAEEWSAIADMIRKLIR